MVTYNSTVVYLNPFTPTTSYPSLVKSEDEVTKPSYSTSEEVIREI